MLEVADLSVEADGKLLLEDINLVVSRSAPAVLFGPNGSGKSTLLKTIMGFGGYHIRKGDIVFKGKKINGLPIEQRVKMGLGIMHQHSPKITGVQLRQIARFLEKDEDRIAEAARRLSVGELLDRDMNLGFSGGEIKRAELFQLMMQAPEFLLLDEPESGVDLENIAVMGRALNDSLKKPGSSALVITHTGYILDYVKAEHGCVLIEGRLRCAGDPKEIFRSIREYGYEKCGRCPYVPGTVC